MNSYRGMLSRFRPTAHATSHEAGKGDEIRITRLQGRDIQDHIPLDNEVLTWITANSQWEPSAGGAGPAHDAKILALMGL